MSRAAGREFMHLAIEEMRKSPSPGAKVGAVLVVDDEVVAAGHRSPGAHAERAVIELAQQRGVPLANAALYSTLEPCVAITSSKEPCAKLIAGVGISTVFIGRYDTNPHIYREGWKLLRDAGIVLRDFDSDLREMIDAVNSEFTEHFTFGIGPRGGAKFDYLLNGGRFEIQYSDDDERRILTRWTRCGRGSIYAYAVQPVQVALARHAREFAEPSLPRLGETVIFQELLTHEGEREEVRC
jgi:diaminohydroxyphosphoribosylaminopyrimidine deaminase / 5-amino-6-(5-phosphoribosylamino)uracil reductase